MSAGASFRQTPANREPVRVLARKKKPFTTVVIPLLAVIAASMLFLAVPNIVTGTDSYATIKALLLAASAAVVAYAVNRLAIERGAPLAVIGFRGAGVLSIGAILFVGCGLYAGTYSGLTILDVELQRQHQHGAVLSEYVGDRSSAAAEATRAQPVMRVIADDLESKARCEVANSCVSGRANGGRGPVARVLEEKAGRAAAIAGELEGGNASRLKAIAELKRLLAAYQRGLDQSGKSAWEQRADLQIVDADMRQAIGALDEAMPVALLEAYAAELQAGVSIADHPEATRRLNAILNAHGQSLAAVLASLGASDAVQPEFPPRAGVSDTFAYVGHFLPIALVVAVVELIFPLLLWTYTYWAIRWQSYKTDPAAFATADETGTALEQISDRAVRPSLEASGELAHSNLSDATRNRHAGGRNRRHGRNGSQAQRAFNGTGAHANSATGERGDAR